MIRSQCVMKAAIGAEKYECVVARNPELGTLKSVGYFKVKLECGHVEHRQRGRLIFEVPMVLACAGCTGRQLTDPELSRTTERSFAR